jgi:uncharacterized membrane protein
MPKGRVESFGDYVIAFAITLLILDIHLQNVGTTTNNAEMIHAIMALAPHFLIYVISFLICTVAWIAHHEFIHDLDHVDSRLLWLNSLYLMWIAFLPFPTALLGNHPEQPRGRRRLRFRLRRYVPFFFGCALVRLLSRRSHEERNQRQEAGP